MREDATRTITNLTSRPVRMSGKVKVLLWTTFAIRLSDQDPESA